MPQGVGAWVWGREEHGEEGGDKKKERSGGGVWGERMTNRK